MYINKKLHTSSRFARLRAVSKSSTFFILPDLSVQHFLYMVALCNAEFGILYFSRASLVPVMSFGENDLFTQPHNPPESRLRRYQNAIQKILLVAPVPFFGRLFVLPHQKPINTVGKIL